MRHAIVLVVLCSAACYPGARSVSAEVARPSSAVALAPQPPPPWVEISGRELIARGLAFRATVPPGSFAFRRVRTLRLVVVQGDAVALLSIDVIETKTTAASYAQDWRDEIDRRAVLVDRTVTTENHGRSAFELLEFKGDHSAVRTYHGVEAHPSQAAHLLLFTLSCDPADAQIFFGAARAIADSVNVL